MSFKSYNKWAEVENPVVGHYMSQIRASNRQKGISDSQVSSASPKKQKLTNSGVGQSDRSSLPQLSTSGAATEPKSLLQGYNSPQKHKPLVSGSSRAKLGVLLDAVTPTNTGAGGGLPSAAVGAGSVSSQRDDSGGKYFLSARLRRAGDRSLRESRVGLGVSASGGGGATGGGAVARHASVGELGENSQTHTRERLWVAGIDEWLKKQSGGRLWISQKQSLAILTTSCCQSEEILQLVNPIRTRPIFLISTPR